MENGKTHLCPVWVGYLLVNPLRMLLQHPGKIIGPYINDGMKVMDFGCAMGYFSIPMAQKVGKEGNVYCVDIQDKMLIRLQKRAKRQKVLPVIKSLLIKGTDAYADLPYQLDFVLLFAVVHEVPDKQKLFDALSARIKTNGTILFAEPRSHVTPCQFEESLKCAESSGLRQAEKLKISRSHAILLCKNSQYQSPE
jgi:2-polyprenyl-3-methyl-5-hydroxy-6-metoxy-1,4-benzoquinol methylase